MKKLAILLIGFITLTACSGSQKSKTDEQVTETEVVAEQVGGEKDDKGCLTAAGETWSDLQQSCIQLHEVAVRLNPVEVEEDTAVISAFVLTNEENTQLELFIEGVEGSVILDAAEDGVFQNEAYKYNAEEKALYVEDAVVYKAEEE